MKARKILIPVLGSLTSSKIKRNSFWLARAQPAELHLVEIKLPVGFFKWLLTPAIDRFKNLIGSQIRHVQQQAVAREKFNCEISELKAPDLVRGIIGAALQEDPDTIILLPEISSSPQVIAMPHSMP